MSKTSKLFIVFVVLAAIAVSVFLYATRENENPLTIESCSELFDTHTPQETPESILDLERDMLSQGVYCYNLSMFDEKWQQRGRTLTYNERYKYTAELFDEKYETYIEGDLAIIYYPEHDHLGPEFFFKTDEGWVLDRTSVLENVSYNYTNDGWFVSSGSGEYLSLVRSVYDMEAVSLDNGHSAFQIRK